MTEIEMYDHRLSSIINDWAKRNLHEKDWEAISIDPSKDIVVFKRYKMD